VPSPHSRSIVREEGFESSLLYLFSDWRDAEAYLAPAEEVLAMDATLGTEFEDGVWTLPMAPVRGADIWLFYTFYDTVVVLQEVKAFLT
jgi:hypothetical protein